MSFRRPRRFRPFSMISMIPNGAYGLVLMLPLLCFWLVGGSIWFDEFLPMKMVSFQKLSAIRMFGCSFFNIYMYIYIWVFDDRLSDYHHWNHPHTCPSIANIHMSHVFLLKNFVYLNFNSLGHIPYHMQHIRQKGMVYLPIWQFFFWDKCWDITFIITHT